MRTSHATRVLLYSVTVECDFEKPVRSFQQCALRPFFPHQDAVYRSLYSTMLQDGTGFLTEVVCVLLLSDVGLALSITILVLFRLAADHQCFVGCFCIDFGASSAAQSLRKTCFPIAHYIYDLHMRTTTDEQVLVYTP